MTMTTETTTLTMTLTTTTTNLAVTTRTTTMTRTKTTKAMMNNSEIFFSNIILIICAALGANQRKYHGVSPSHPMDDQFCGNPTLSTNGRDFGTVYLLTYVQIR